MNKAGRSTRKMAKERRSAGVKYLLIMLVIAGVLVFLSRNIEAFGIGGFDFLAIVLFLMFIANLLEAGADRQFKAENRAVRGARAEESVADLLHELSGDYYVLHDIQSPHGNIDHIVITKQNGVFLCETKSHYGKVTVTGTELMVNGKPPEKNFISQALRNAFWLKEMLKNLTGSEIWITAVVIFANAFVAPSHPIKGVHIINKKYLVTTLRKGRQNDAGMRAWEVRENIEDFLINSL